LFARCSDDARHCRVGARCNDLLERIPQKRVDPLVGTASSPEIRIIDRKEKSTPLVCFRSVLSNSLLAQAQRPKHLLAVGAVDDDSEILVTTRSRATTCNDDDIDFRSSIAERGDHGT
jgi:hypothetical protein